MPKSNIENARLLWKTASYEVAVLLSTYNGGKFLQNQLDSIYRQSLNNVLILVRDDGSTDETRKILELEQAKGRLVLIEGSKNLGPAFSFFELLKTALHTKVEYFAFCDQDDVWHPKKLAQAISKLGDISGITPAMYCSTVELVDENLNQIGYTEIPKNIGFGNALVESIAAGCSMVINRTAANIIAKNLPQRAVIHDWWCYLVVSCFGQVFFDSTSYIKYRQHSNNSIGVAKNRLTRYRRRLKRFFGGDEKHLWMSLQASSMFELFENDIPAQNRETLQTFIQAKARLSQRLKLATSNLVWRQSRLDNFFLRVLILINRY
jgi:glycosyltransferase involved in cell wall biosynthesis